MPSSRALATTTDPIELLEQAEVLRRRAEQSFGEYALEAGRLLIAAKRRVAHGSWASHLQTHTGFSQRTAESYMRARRIYEGLPASEKAAVLEQPFSRSLLVLSQAPRQSSSEDRALAELPDKRERRELPPRGVPENGSTQAVENFLNDRGLDTTQLIEDSYHPDVETPEFKGEATPLDDILDGPQKTYDDGISQQAINEEQLQEYEEMSQEVARLERENRDLQNQLAQAKSNPQQMRGWDFVQSLYQYLRADEPARTPESLAKRAAGIQGGRETVAYLEQFFGATRNDLRLAEGEPLPA